MNWLPVRDGHMRGSPSNCKIAQWYRLKQSKRGPARCVTRIVYSIALVLTRIVEPRSTLATILGDVLCSASVHLPAEIRIQMVRFQ